MNKKRYEKPDMQVVKIQQRCNLLVESGYNNQLQGEEVDEAW